MSSNNREVSIGGMILLFVVLLNAVIVQHAFIRNAAWYWALLFTLPLLMLAVYGMCKKKDEQSIKPVEEIYFNNKLLPVKQEHIQSFLN